MRSLSLLLLTSLSLSALNACTEEDTNIASTAGTELTPVAGAEPVAGMEPVAGAEPVAGMVPVAGAEPVAGMEPVAGAEPVASDCDNYCTYLESCDACLYDEAGECADQATCVAICEAEVPAVAAACVATLDTCDEDTFNSCYDATIGDDDCAQTCVLLEECGECFADEAGECLSLAACAAVCREQTPAEAASCLANTTSCEGIDACFE